VKMKRWIGMAMLVTLAAWGTTASAAQDTKATGATTAAADNMTPYRTLASDTLTAFKAHDVATTKKKAKELEKAWDNDQKALQKQSPDVWGQIDKAMDAFIKPVQQKTADPAQVHHAYDAFIAKRQLAVKGK
jgi:hypothetical protein